jgi:hypothetical protein
MPLPMLTTPLLSPTDAPLDNDNDPLLPALASPDANATSPDDALLPDDKLTDPLNNDPSPLDTITSPPRAPNDPVPDTIST